MREITLRELADVVGGTVHDGADDVIVKAPAFVDSRKAQAGGLFVALPGERVDGHEYVEAALSGGAAAVLAQRPVGAPAVVVADGVEALGRLSEYLVSRGGSDMTVLGITGSAGKTTTKDLIAHLLGTRGATVATPGNFNNEIGLPLTVSLATEDTRFLVLEMGARAIGHIKYLTEIAPPSIGVVTNIGTAHLGEFGGYEATTQGKGELVEALPSTGLAVLNADDERVLSMRPRTKANVVLFGLSQDADIRASDIVVDERGHAHFTLHTPEGSAPVVLQLVGEHQVGNALAAAAVARHIGLSTEELAAGLGTAIPESRGRLEITDRPDGVVIVNDAYNANPHSTRAALRALLAMAKGRRTIVVLGAMLGLGDEAEPEHRAMGALTAELSMDIVITVGGLKGAEEAGWIADGAAAAGVTVIRTADNVEARIVLDKLLAPGDTVLFKASQPAGLQPLAEQLAGQAETVH
ncbi:UDP-N-acetylmuramoyl-tripeptide--D-alanyl-D-alanine ligase [Actinospica sp.]|uniref:UDP-N-acetylmuramoyl-tripeptide--D-alanyl-D- alanine ligase n=1 Tax=Actinospica sp. TaxID=1872142 RepID=UPI002CD20B16|nr:UDP-N-acetylmuramoyl-tripeptide--D-alanyl-D-alanine ligase [Actinospica sp.]HWG22956.1 UDP-N-acetylmuramoyl-tripeptide--D-alanyl-D-alanine ligase [Actinospica sp.]